MSFDPSFSPDLTPAVLSSLLKLHDEQDSDEAQLPIYWRVYESQDSKGYGVRASQAIPRGTRLIAERPLCVWPNGLSAQQARSLFEAMPDEAARNAFMDLSVGNAAKDMDPVLARRATNGFAVQIEGAPTLGMVFSNISRINHSCLPNASQAFNPLTFRMEVYAIRDIEQDEEICIEYLPSLVYQTKSERAAALKTTFMMNECLCPLCTSNPDIVGQSDDRRTQIRRISRSLADGRLDRQAALQSMADLKQLLATEVYLGPPEFGSSLVTQHMWSLY